MAKFTSNDADSLKIFTYHLCTQRRTATPNITEAHFYICNLSVINLKTIIIIIFFSLLISCFQFDFYFFFFYLFIYLFFICGGFCHTLK